MTAEPIGDPRPPSDLEFLSMKAAKSILGQMALSIVRLATYSGSSQSADVGVRAEQLQELRESLEAMIRSLAEANILGAEDEQHG